ncbi:AI-2E family transporter [Candidatus Peregrinibacteria bacterium]|nr:AI-2E family transporter [Candidatus Peregrinibacteria bacterium]
MPFRFKRTTKSLFKRSQQKISELKKRLQSLSMKEKELEKEEKKLMHEVEGPKKEMRVSLSIDSIVKATMAVLGVIGFAYLLFYLKSIIILFLVALFLAAAFNPAVDRLQQYKIPRGLGIFIVYLIVLGIITLIFTSLVPIIAEQVSSLAYSVRDMIQNIVSGQGGDSWFIRKIQPVANQIWQNVDQAQILNSLTTSLREVGSKLTSFAGNAIGAIFTVFNGIFNLLLVLIITFFMVVNKQHTSNFFHSLFPHKYSGYISQKTKEVSIKIGEWIRGQVLLALAMGLLTFIVFSIIGINYALTLAMVSALAEFIPYLGPLITFLSATLIALNQDPVLVLWLIPAYAVMQFLEGNIMVPLIVGRSVGLNPVVVIFALMAGATIGYNLGDGIGLALVGMIIAVPMANIISIFVADYTGKNK